MSSSPFRHPSKKKIIYLVTEDWFFCSHRLPVARAMRDSGFDVIVATRIGEHSDSIRREGFDLVKIGLTRKNSGVWLELRSILELIRLYRSEKPDLIHHVALKPIMYGSLAGLFYSKARIINSITGFGFLFTSTHRWAKVIRLAVLGILAIFLRRKHSRVILQNPDDWEVLSQATVPDSQMTIIRGSGVNTKIFSFCPPPKGISRIVLASRMLWDKGVGEYVQAARILKEKNINADFLLVGDTDPSNPNSIPPAQLREWQQHNWVKWLGRQTEMNTIFQSCNLVCLPSYREGLPKVLLEAASCGRPIVATDVPGCREIVHDGQNGFLVPPRNADLLAEALEKLITNPALREAMGKASRNMVEEFTEEKIVAETMSVYRNSLQS